MRAACLSASEIYPKYVSKTCKKLSFNGTGWKRVWAPLVMGWCQSQRNAGYTSYHLNSEAKQQYAIKVMSWPKVAQRQRFDVNSGQYYKIHDVAFMPLYRSKEVSVESIHT